MALFRYLRVYQKFVEMDRPRRLPISTQDFEKLRRQGDIYVDKTQYIAKLLALGNVFFLSRPHRFGKSLFLSTLKAYFEGKRELFKGLAIEKDEQEMASWQGREPWEKHPVLYIELNAERYATPQDLENTLETHLAVWEELYGSDGVAKTHSSRFAAVVRKAYEKTQQQVVILIDEYDKPLLETVNDEALNATNRSLLKAFYEVLKQSDRYIYFAFLTGITKFSKTTLFSGVNNLRDISLSDDYAAICGFTEQELDQLTPEIEKLAEVNKSTVEKTRARLKKEYDGYCFSRNGEHIYNPYSLLNVLADSVYNYYWFESATPSYLVNYLQRTDVFFPSLEDEIKLDASMVQDFRYNDNDSVIPLLFQSGYLTIKRYLMREGMFQLGYPNEEVRFSFLQELLPLYAKIKRDQIRSLVFELYDHLNSGNLAGVMAQVETFLAGIIYGNIPRGEEGRPLREQYYQSVLYAIFRLLGIYAQSEVVCATGRIDMIVSTHKHVYLFEFKVTTQGTAQDAIEQIKARGYLKKIRKTKRPIHLVGVSFDEKTRNIGEWEEEVVASVHR